MGTTTLAGRFADGDQDAVRDVWHAFGRPLFASAVRLLGDRSLAEEAVQEAMVRAWRAAATVDPERNIGPWLFTILRRVAIDIHRREARRPAVATGAVADEAGGIVQLPSIDRAWDIWQVRLAVDSLAPDEQEIVRLQHFDGLTHTEIAERTGVPIGTVKSRSHRAHRRLADALAGLREDG